MGNYNFDEIIPRRETGSAKWGYFDEDVLPLWVADMDFRLPQEIIDALKTRAEHGLFGYEFGSETLKTTIVERLSRLYNWTITPEDIMLLPGVIPGLSMAVKAFSKAGNKALIQTPVYFPFYNVTTEQGVGHNLAPLTLNDNDGLLHYTIDEAAFEAKIDFKTDIFILCNPHNPVGRVWTRDELTAMADACLKHDTLIISDEIHSDLIFDDYAHVPIASLSPEISAKTITLMATSKSFNMPGLGAAYAIIADARLRDKFKLALSSISAHAYTMGLVGTLAAYQHGDAWLKEALEYMQANRDFTADFLRKELPQIKFTCPEGTYLMWLDFRALNIEKIGDFLLEKARVSLNDGAWFGEDGVGYARLNLACPRATLEQALIRIRDAINNQ